MVILMAYKSNQLLFTTQQLLEIIPWSERGLYRLAQELIIKKIDVREMGMYRFDGIRSDMWDPKKLVNYLINHKLNKKVHYNHEHLEQDNIQKALMVNFNQQIQERKKI